MKNILIMSSKNGSNFEAIIKYFKKRNDINFKLLTDNKDAYVIKRAKKLGIDYICVLKDEIKDFFLKNKFDLVVMAGFFKILDKETIETNTFINIHPSLLPKYKGLNAIEYAYINNDLKTGITIHYANEFVDEGEIIFQKELEINPNWSLRKLEKEIHKLEHYYYPRIIEKLLGLNVLVVGGGAREHVIAQKISKSKLLNTLYLADCNDGFSSLGNKIEYTDYINLALQAQKRNISLVVIGSEEYLANGLVDVLNKYKIKTIGPDKNFARLESSKLFAKKLMEKYNIKTAPYKKITSKNKIDKYLSYFKSPIIKADGLAKGKGVYLSDDINSIKKELLYYLNGKFDKSSKTTLIEERLFGDEISLFSFWDGENLLHFPLCRDFKQNEKNENTGGLASICPIEIDFETNKKLDIYKNKLFELLKKEKIKTPFVVYSGLIITKDDVYVLEYNVRLGDPESQSLLNYIQNDWLEIFYMCSIRALSSIKLIENNKQITTIVMTSRGYPNEIKKGVEIKNINSLNNKTEIYFSNIIKSDGKILSDGGRVLSVTSDNRSDIYRALNDIEFSEKEFKILDV